MTCNTCGEKFRTEYKSSEFELPGALAYTKNVLKCRSHYLDKHGDLNELSGWSVAKVISKRIGVAITFDALVLLVAAIFLPFKIICFPFWWVYKNWLT